MPARKILFVFGVLTLGACTPPTQVGLSQIVVARPGTVIGKSPIRWVRLYRAPSTPLSLLPVYQDPNHVVLDMHVPHEHISANIILHFDAGSAQLSEKDVFAVRAAVSRAQQGQAVWIDLGEEIPDIIERRVIVVRNTAMRLGLNPEDITLYRKRMDL